jgi:hypothetical protein
MYHLLAGPTRSLVSTWKMYPDSSAIVPEHARQHNNREIPGILVHATLPFDVVAPVRESKASPYEIQVHVSSHSLVVRFPRQAL